jgi:hypothetical protein
MRSRSAASSRAQRGGGAGGAYALTFVLDISDGVAESRIMKILELLGPQWQYLLSMLPAGFDLEATARQTGALVRPE